MKPLSFRDIAPRNVNVPPVTGVRNSLAPHANAFDSSGTFRDRSGSQKRRRRDGQDELLDTVYDLTNDFPPASQPEKPTIDVAAIKHLLVEAASQVEGLQPLLEKEDSSPEAKAIFSVFRTFVNLVGAVVEKGVEPISTAVVGVSGNPAGRGFAAAARRLATQAPQPPEPGKKELLDALKKAETESVLFGANLGNAASAHRGTLNANFTADLRNRTLEKNAGQPKPVLDESLRLVEDALSCVDNLEFLGQRSKAYTLPGGKESNYCSMPIKLTFGDKDARVNFERTVRSSTGLRVSQSLPQEIRNHMAAFRKALEGRYEDHIIMVRPDPKSLSYVALKKIDGEEQWTTCFESLPIPPGIMLPNFKAAPVILPPPMDSGGEGDMGES